MVQKDQKFWQKSPKKTKFGAQGAKNSLDMRNLEEFQEIHENFKFIQEKIIPKRPNLMSPPFPCYCSPDIILMFCENLEHPG